MNEFQYRLLKVIAERNITASELSKQSGIDKSSLSNYINGVYEPKQDKVFKLARALNVDPGWLMTGEEPAENKFPDVIELHDSIMVEKNEDFIVYLAYTKAEEWQKTAVKKILGIELEKE